MLAPRARALSISTAAALSACSLHSLEPLLCPEDDPTCAREGGNGDAGGPAGSDGAAGPVDAATPPADAATARGELELLYASVNPDELLDKQIRLVFALRNVSRDAIPLAELTVRYYFTTESGGDQEYVCASVTGGPFGCDDVTARAEVFAGEGANRVLAFGFRAEAGELAGDGARTGEIKGLIRNVDFSELDQSNDYSFGPQDELAPHVRMTVYRGDRLLWGEPP